MGKAARQIARKHHYVPELYLSGFANAKGQCFTVDAERRSTFTAPPKGISAERDFNLIEARSANVSSITRVQTATRSPTGITHRKRARGADEAF